MANTLQFKVRLDEYLHGQIKKAAEANNRSVNAEIVERLKETIKQDEIVDRKDDFLGISSTLGFTRVGAFYDKYSELGCPNENAPEFQDAFREEIRKRLTAIEKILDK